MIDIKSISYSYNQDGNCLSLKNIDLKIKKGECVLFCGKSGSGKTSATRLINGIIPNFYDGNIFGKILMGGENLLELPMYEIAKKVGSVFQNPRTQFYTVNTSSEIAFGCENYGLEPEEIERRINMVSDDLNISYLLNRSIFNLSGGEKQILAFASIYAMKPDIYVLDEPSSNLDVSAIKKIRKIIALLKKQGKTIVIAEHRIYYLKDLVDRVIYFKDGQIAKEFTMNDFSSFELKDHIETGIRMSDLKEFHVSKYEEYTKTKTMEINNLNYSYKESNALRIDNLKLLSGGIIGIIGENGAGKSTFAHAICGLLKKIQGNISIDGKTLYSKDRLRESYIVMQDVNHQLFSDNVEDEIILGTEKITEESLSLIVEKLNIDDLKSRHPMTLSGGQKQRVVIASAIASKKNILFFDEPTSGLDFTNMMEFCNLLSGLKGQDKFIFVITHDYELIVNLCDSVVHLENGAVKNQYKMNKSGLDKFNNYFFRGLY